MTQSTDGTSHSGPERSRERPDGGGGTVADLCRSLTDSFHLAMADAERVRKTCDLLREALGDSPGAADAGAIHALVPLLARRGGPMAAHLFDFLEETAVRSPDPWSCLDGMMGARDHDLARRALGTAARLADEGTLAVDRPLLLSLSRRVQEEGSPLGAPQSLTLIRRMIRHFSLGRPPEHEDLLCDLFLDKDGIGLNHLAACILDMDVRPAPSDLAARLLGSEPYAFLAPYLEYTRASHRDLLHLLPLPGAPPPCLPSLLRAAVTCGPALLREIIAEIGWTRVNFGLDIRRFTGVSIGGSFPLALSPEEASLFRDYERGRGGPEQFLVVAHGGPAVEPGRAGGEDDPVARFRSYNVAHAEALADILDVAPLTRAKVNRILDRADRFVRDFVLLFSVHSDECAILPDVYAELKRKILAELEREEGETHLSAELTRLVQMFEEPASLGDVRTLHGLKRYLHQRGLRLAFRLVEGSRATNRTVDMAIASPKRVKFVSRQIGYIDFEPDQEAEGDPTAIPYPVRLVVDGFGRQLLYGQENLPGVKVFCYGNEVHYYIAYGNHPAFLRIDYSPPLRGGMIDLEYYGVSKNELGQHPDPSLHGIRLFFQELQFDIHVEKTHIHARYDKERALDLGDLCEKAEALFRLVPYLMEVDWVIGSLDLGEEARRGVARAWAESFALWGVLPVRHLLTKDRRGILRAIEPGPTGEREIAWDGEGEYGDLYRKLPPAGLVESLRASFDRLGLETLPNVEELVSRPLGQIRVERLVLQRLRAAIERGEVLRTPQGLARQDSSLFRREHEAERFAAILAAGGMDIASSAVVAELLSPLERTLRFQTTGSVNGYDVQRARLALRGETLGVYVLRDAGGVVRLALFARGEAIYLHRKDPSKTWSSNAGTQVSGFAPLLRASGYLTVGAAISPTRSVAEMDDLIEQFLRPNPARRRKPVPGERLVTGLRASPGRAVGIALFGTENRDPRDFDGAILVAPSVRPEDNTFLYHSEGIVSTGGGILSHAGLIATQFRKPSLIIPGEWVERDGKRLLLYRTVEYEEERRDRGDIEVCVRRNVREREHPLVEGDLVVLDANEGTLRVLGQDRQAATLHDGLRHFAAATERLSLAKDEGEILRLRGRRLRARHEIEGVLARLTDPVLVRHAVYELLLGEHLTAGGGRSEEKARLLSILLGSDAAGEAARAHVLGVFDELGRRCRTAAAEAERLIPSAPAAYEILCRRLGLFRLAQAMAGAEEALEGCGLATPQRAGTDLREVDELSRVRLAQIRSGVAEALRSEEEKETKARAIRHLLRRLERLDLLLGEEEETASLRETSRARLAAADRNSLARHENDRVLHSKECGFELYPLIGWKAANLGEVERLGGDGLVPPWFAVSQAAFQEMLDLPVPRGSHGGALPETGTVRAAIEAVLEREDLSNNQKSRTIEGIWRVLPFPDALAEPILEAYRTLGGYVAIRSSSREEDAEAAARAGEFETFLFIRGEAPLLDHLKLAWSGLWTERAIHNRSILGQGFQEAGGGVIVQRIIPSRVSGVLQTVNVAEGALREIVINAGLGLGEGIVSGTVAADQIVVAKEGDLMNGPLHFRYITSDKEEQVVFNERTGLGTVRTETLYHQRLRPALEYVELAELVAVASRLEEAYGYPLDIEYGIEGTKLWILQARPVPTFLSALQETRELFPLVHPARTGKLPSQVKETKP